MSFFSVLRTADRFLLDRSEEKMRALYERMGGAYDLAASCYGFSCRGCEENCCEERFYHHTLAEYLYLMKGIQACDDLKRKDIFERAREVGSLYMLHDRGGQAQRVMCPLNMDGLCSLYEYRLMICRLHGVPYKMRRPDGIETQAAGCHLIDWDMSSPERAECMLDRTDLYRELSAIEIELRRSLGFGHRIKLTIAEMITDIEELLAVQ